MCRSKVLSKTLKISSIFCRCLNELSINFQSIQLLKFTQYPRIIDIHNNIILWQAGMHIVLFVRLFAYIFLPFCLRLTLSRICFSRYCLLYTAIVIVCLHKLNMFELYWDISMSFNFTYMYKYISESLSSLNNLIKFV